MGCEDLLIVPDGLDSLLYEIGTDPLLIYAGEEDLVIEGC